jgi:hypothetical protein
MGDIGEASGVEPTIERELEACKYRLAGQRAPFVMPPLAEITA